MSSFQEEQRYPGKSPAEVYQAALKAFPQAGFKIWKQRDLGYFVIARRVEHGVEISGNVMARPGAATTLTVGMSAEGLAQEDLQQYAGQFLAALQRLLEGRT